KPRDLMTLDCANRKADDYDQADRTPGGQREMTYAALVEPSERIMMHPDGVTIGVVDDETEIREMVAEYLSRHAFSLVQADSSANFRRILETRRIDLALLDISMPGQNGLSLARYLREQTDIGIIMLTAAAESDDRIAGLELGADDYMGKPFNPRE